jgi:hypothetical protein
MEFHSEANPYISSIRTGIVIYSQIRSAGRYAIRDDKEEVVIVE